MHLPDDLSVFRIRGEVIQFPGIILGVVEFKFGMPHNTVDFLLSSRIRPGLLQPGAPGSGKGLAAVGLHHDIEVVVHLSLRIPNQLELLIAKRALGIATGLMDQVSVVAMIGGFSAQHGPQALAIHNRCFSSGDVHQGRRDVTIHPHRIGHARLDLVRPAKDAERPGSIVVDRPFAVRQSSPLFAQKNQNGIIGQLEIVQQLHRRAHLIIENFHFRCMGSQRLTRHRGVHHMRWNQDLIEREI